MTWYKTSYISIGPRNFPERKTARIRFSGLYGLGQPVPKRQEQESGFVSFWSSNPTQIALTLDQIDTAIILIRKTSQIDFESYLLWSTVVEPCLGSHIFIENQCSKTWSPLVLRIKQMIIYPLFPVHSETISMI